MDGQDYSRASSRQGKLKDQSRTFSEDLETGGNIWKISILKQKKKTEDIRQNLIILFKRGMVKQTSSQISGL